MRKKTFGLVSVLLTGLFALTTQSATATEVTEGKIEVYHEDIEHLSLANQQRIIPAHVDPSQVISGVYTLVYQDETGMVYANTTLPETGEQLKSFYQLLLSGAVMVTGVLVLRKNRLSKSSLLLTLTVLGMTYSATVAAKSALSLTEFVLASEVKAKHFEGYRYIGYYVDEVGQPQQLTFHPIYTVPVESSIAYMTEISGGPTLNNLYTHALANQLATHLANSSRDGALLSTTLGQPWLNSTALSDNVAQGSFSGLSDPSSQASSVNAGVIPTILPTEVSTEVPTELSIEAPSEVSTELPSEAPTEVPTELPSEVATVLPTLLPTLLPTILPTEAPTLIPTILPTLSPTVRPTVAPTTAPTARPTSTPTTPTIMPTSSPTVSPTAAPDYTEVLDATVGAALNRFDRTLKDIEVLLGDDLSEITKEDFDYIIREAEAARQAVENLSPAGSQLNKYNEYVERFNQLKAQIAKILDAKSSTESPSEVPTQAPTELPTEVPTQAPTELPTEIPTQAPIDQDLPTVDNASEASALLSYEVALDNYEAALINGGSFLKTGTYSAVKAAQEAATNVSKSTGALEKLAELNKRFEALQNSTQPPEDVTGNENADAATAQLITTFIQELDKLESRINNSPTSVAPLRSALNSTKAVYERVWPILVNSPSYQVHIDRYYYLTEMAQELINNQEPPEGRLGLNELSALEVVVFSVEPELDQPLSFQSLESESRPEILEDEVFDWFDSATLIDDNATALIQATAQAPELEWPSVFLDEPVDVLETSLVTEIPLDDVMIDGREEEVLEAERLMSEGLSEVVDEAEMLEPLTTELPETDEIDE